MIKRLESKDLASPGIWVFDRVEDYKAVNDSVLRIKLNAPFPPFLGILSMQYCSVVPKEVIGLYQKGEFQTALSPEAL